MRFLITAGPTREPIDPVRYIGNRSSGKMGYALAEAAVDAGHEVVLVSGPVSLSPPPKAEIHSVETARQMYDAVRENLPGCDVAIFSAAVGDYRVDGAAEQKIKKTGRTLTLTLVENPDILGSARSVFGFEGFLVGFAAETQNVEANAESKRQKKGCDLLIANDVSRKDIGFDSDENEVAVYSRAQSPKRFARESKESLARKLISLIEESFAEK